MTGERRCLTAVALATCALALGACGGDDSAERDRFLPGNPRSGSGALSGAAQANCKQWNAASYRQRQDVVEQLGKISNRGNYPGQPGAKLPDDEAYDVLERACKPEHATYFRLHKLYTRALIPAPR